jgi:hypothetical protein
MNEQNDKNWEPMDVEEAGHVGEVMQGSKISSGTRNDDEEGPVFDLLEA